jgi:hypothetical protein
MPNEDKTEEPITIPEVVTEISPEVKYHKHWKRDIWDSDAITSVNTKTGVVVLNPDDLDDTSTTHKFTSATEIAKLSGIPDGTDIQTKLAYPSTTLQLSDDTEADSGAGGGAYVKVKELTSTVSGAIKTMFEIKKNGDNGPTTTIAGKIYVDGVAVGAEHITDNTHTDGYEVFTDASISVDIGSLVQVYMKSIDSAYDGQCQNFRLYWDLSTKEYVDAGDDAILDELTDFKAGVLTGFDIAAGGGDQNVDESVTLTFLPRRIKLTYYLQGNQDGGNGVNHQFATTIFEGTTPTVTHISAQKTSSGSDDAVPTTIVKKFQTTPDTCGVSTGTGGIKTTLTILSVSSTGFVVRVAIDEGSSPQGTARFHGFWEAFK